VKCSEQGYINYQYENVACNDQFLVASQQNTENYLFLQWDSPIVWRGTGDPLSKDVSGKI
jgi:hypothetical protein